MIGRSAPPVSTLLDHPAVGEARRIIAETDDRTLRDQVELTRIPAPPFGEDARAARMVTLLREAGLGKVRRDGVGNVLAELGGEGGDAPFVVSAHLDTIFPGDTEILVREEEGRWVGPGISDDGRGLAALVTLGRALTGSGLCLAGPLLFAATVGEEGPGDLRGVKHLFGPGGEARQGRGFLSLDGAGIGRIVIRGLGVRRLRLGVRGPGGHSWADRGRGNPIHALARTVARGDALELPETPAVGITAARWGGGTSINAIPGEAWVEFDLRCESGRHLRDAEERLRRIAGAEVATANATREGGEEGLSLRIEVIGDRPPGATNPESLLVQSAVEATRALGHAPQLVASSTDANLPMSLGIPAITMGAGGRAGNAHTVEEWYRNEGGAEGVVRALLTIAGCVGLS